MWRRHASQEVWIQLEYVHRRDAGCLGHRGQRRSRGHAHGVVRERCLRAELHAVPHRLLAHQRGGDQLRDVVACLGLQIVLLGQHEEGVFTHRGLHVAGVLRHAA